MTAAPAAGAGNNEAAPATRSDNVRERAMQIVATLVGIWLLVVGVILSLVDSFSTPEIATLLGAVAVLALGYFLGPSGDHHSGAGHA